MLNLKFSKRELSFFIFLKQDLYSIVTTLDDKLKMVSNNYNITDKELFELLSQSKEKRDYGFSTLYLRHSQRIYQYCRRILGSDELASDVLQETFLRLLNSNKSVAEMTNIPAFLLRVARNLCIDIRKKESKMLNHNEIEIPSYDDSLEIKELKQLLVLTIDLLPEDQKEAIVLQTYSGMSYQEISEFTNVPISTVRNWIVRGKKRMRELLTSYIKELEL